MEVTNKLNSDEGASYRDLEEQDLQKIKCGKWTRH